MSPTPPASLEDRAGTDPTPPQPATATPWLGVDLGGTSIKWVVLGPDDVVLRQGAVATPRSGVDDVLAAIARIADQHGPSGGDACAGLAVPGSVDHETSRVLALPNIAGDWRGVTLSDALSARTGRPWRVINDARAFAVGELRTGVARDVSDALFITLGTGVGGALAVHGAVEMGGTGLIGEIGHVSVEPGGRPCRCGGHGCLEAYAGADGMLAEAQRRGFNPASSDVDHGRTHPLAALFKAADAGEPVASGVVREAGRALGSTLGRLATFLAAELVVLGGGVSRGFAALEPSLRAALAECVRVVPEPELRLTERPEFAGAIGSALWADQATPVHARHPRPPRELS